MQRELDLKERIKVMQQELDILEREKTESVTVRKFSLVGLDKIEFYFDKRRSDFLDNMKNLGVDIVDSYKIVTSMEYFKSTVRTKLDQIPRVKVIMNNDEFKMIETWKKAPDLYIDYNKEHTYVIFNLTSPKISTTPLYRNPNISLHGSYNKYVLNVSNLTELNTVLEYYQTHYATNDVELSPEVAADLMRDNKARDYIDKLLSANDEDLPIVELNGFKLTPVQVKALEFLKASKGNGIIAIKMGKGKTLTTFAYMDWYWNNVDKEQKFLILGPASLRPNWAKQVLKHLLNEPVYQITTMIPNSFDMANLITKNDYRLFYMNYDILSRVVKKEDDSKIFPWVPILDMANLKLIVDEAHYLKNRDATRTKAIHTIAFKSAALLTGTPMKNGPYELHSLVKLIQPELAGSYEGWLKTYTYDNGRRTLDAEVMRKVLLPIMYRPKEEEYGLENYNIDRITLDYELSDKAKALYNQILSGFYDDLSKWSGEVSNDSKLIQNLLVQMLRMKQVCSADKVDFVADRAIEQYDSDEFSKHRKVLIFSQFANDPDIVNRIHQKLGHESLMFTGNDDVYTRQKIVDRFQTDDSIHFLVCSTKSAMEGLDITAAGHVIFVDLMYSPSDHSQAEGRAFGRNSDNHGGDATYIIVENSIEDVLVGILHRKMTEISSIIDGKDGEEISEGSVLKELFGSMKKLKRL